MSIQLTLLSNVTLRGREISGPRVRALLAALATDLRGGCSVAGLIDGVWADALPDNPGKALQVLVSRTRAQLGADLIVNTATGYRLALEPDQVDAAALEIRAAAATRHARAGDPEAALTQAESGLALWDGVVGELRATGDPLAELRVARLPAHRALSTIRALSLARSGRYAEALAPLTEVMAREPRNEEVLAELLRAEADTSGPAAALARYDRYRRLLRDELGTDPGEALQSLHRQLLRTGEPLVRQGIRHEPNPLVGREREVAAVSALLRGHRVVSIVGPGGLGKTRLAHTVGAAAEQRSVYLVELASVTSDAAVAAEVAGALGAGELVPGGGTATMVAGIARKLDAGSLLILDNCEQVLAGAAELVSALVSLTRDLRVLVTSRAPLGLSSEAVHQLPALGADAAAELFAQRARAVRPDVELPAEPVAKLCAALDGLPLAVELAAARVRVMSVAEMSQRLVDRFTLLRGGSRDAPTRHRTLAAVVEWSWNLLDEPGRAAMRRLSIFPAGFTAEAGNRLLDGDLVDTLDTLTYLADQSLIQVSGTATDTRFRMLETVREFAAARRSEAGEDKRALREFVAWARDFGLARTSRAFGDLAETSVVRAEQDNLAHALAHALDRADGPAVAAIWAVLGSHWFVGAHYARVAESVRACSWSLSHIRPEPELVEAIRTAAVVGAVHQAAQGGLDMRAMAVLRRLPAAPADTPARALASVLLAGPELLGPDPEPLNRLCDNDAPLLAALGQLLVSVRAEQLGDRETALAATERMLAVLDRAPGDWLEFQARCRIGHLALLSERAEQAHREVNAALDQVAELGPRPDRGDLLVACAMAALQLGDPDAAQAWLAQVPDHTDVFAYPYAQVAQAELRLARGEIEDGLWRWRENAKLVSGTDNPFFRPDPRGVQVWSLEIRAAAVLAHAQHDRLDLVASSTSELAGDAIALLERPSEQPSGHLAELTAVGAVLLALAAVDLAEGQTVTGARLTALAQRFDAPHQIHPTMSGQRARTAAENADGAAYLEARSSYAALDVAGLRAAALAVLRDRITVPVRG
ncbi:BTAD domain-containing putative transcriptional regulator [Nocardia sp. CDC153]|uniref:ATP-binding protein n=1 Tax=Nocardia sp. CDC153 TaxID=3112167 RepID=UPI002DB56F6C|nr:BTAD domain-containing putative transcriptional regulator [Nocardia sp. CDC153]MEC3958037.1 BTAD domain-containing putative transcriptional regulator [Nocardia sp. CDC153]